MKNKRNMLHLKYLRGNEVSINDNFSVYSTINFQNVFLASGLNIRNIGFHLLAL